MIHASFMRDPNLVEDLRRLHPAAWGGWAVLLLVAAVGGAWWWWGRHRRRLRPAAQPAVEGPMPWEVALAALERLAGLLQPEASRAYAVAATDILREYLERRYGWEAPRLTTPEFLHVAAADPALPPDQRAILARFLEACDWMKFGRAVARVEELQTMHESAVAFVLSSRPGGDAG